MNDAAVMIAMTEAKHAAKNETTLEGRLKAAMKATRHHWMLTDEDGQFRAAIGAAVLLSADDEKQRIMKELDHLKLFSAMCNGIPVDFSRVEPLENAIGLVMLWKETL